MALTLAEPWLSISNLQRELGCKIAVVERLNGSVLLRVTDDHYLLVVDYRDDEETSFELRHKIPDLTKFGFTLEADNAHEFEHYHRLEV